MSFTAEAWQNWNNDTVEIKLKDITGSGTKRRKRAVIFSFTEEWMESHLFDVAEGEGIPRYSIPIGEISKDAEIFQFEERKAYTGFAGGDCNLWSEGAPGQRRKICPIQAVAWQQDKDSDAVIGTFLPYSRPEENPYPNGIWSITCRFVSPQGEELTYELEVLLVGEIFLGKQTKFVGIRIS